MENGDCDPSVCPKGIAADLCNISQANSDSIETYISPATAYCAECHESLCDDCSWHHKRQKLSRLHTVVPLSSDIKHEINWKSCVCDKHDREQQMYCTECKLPVCMVCFEEDHQLHRCLTINKAAEDFKNRIESELKKVDDIYLHESSIKCRLEQKERDFIEESRILNDAIVRRGTELKDIVDQHSNSLSRELIRITEKRLTEMEKAKEETANYLMKMENFKVSSNEVISNGSAGEVFKTVDYIIDQVGQIKQWSELHRLPEEIPQSRLSLRKSNIEGFLSSNNIIGTITGVAYSSIRLTASLNVGQKLVCGVAKRQNHIYVLCHGPCSIFVFQDDNLFLLQKEVSANVIRRPCDIVASETSSCLYISDRENNCVWQMEENFRIVRWLENIGDPFTLSLTLDDRLLLLRKGQPSNLELYGPHTSSIQNILQLPRYVANPCHAIETSIGHFLICCGSWNSHTSELYEFTEYGKIVRQINLGLESEHLGIPRHLSADIDGRVFVADSWGSKVVLFDFVLQSGKAVLKENREEFRSPWRLCFDSKKRQLIVVHGRRANGTVSVYSLDPV